MNERINELAMQAYQYAVVASKTSPHFCSPGSDYFHAMEKEKFAELLVKECAQLARDTNLEDVEGGDQSVLRAAKMQILEHFGVEE